jgi:integrase
MVVGRADVLVNQEDAWKAVEGLQKSLNTRAAPPPRTFGQLAEHYCRIELGEGNNRKTYSTKEIYASVIDNWLLLRWSRWWLAEFAITVEIEIWLQSLRCADATKAKIRNIMSAVFSHAIRWGWWKAENPIKTVRQRIEQEKEVEVLTREELQALYSQLSLLDRVLLLLDVPTGMRAGELHAIQWRDIDFLQGILHIHRSIWHQMIGPVKTRKSKGVMPLNPEVITELQRWRSETPYAGEQDWVFASPKMRGRQPYWPSARMRHIRAAAKRVGITKHLSWQVFRHSFCTLLLANNEDVKTVQSLMRHSNIRVTLERYAHAVSGKKRAAQAQIVSGMLPARTATLVQ